MNNPPTGGIRGLAAPGRRIALLTFLVTIAIGSAVRADVVHTRDGSRIVGRIERIHEGKLVLATKIAGTLEIDLSDVTGLRTDGKVHVEFESGDRLVGSIEGDENGTETVMRTALGEIPVPRESIKALWPEGTENPEIVAMRSRMEEERKRLEPKWSVTLEAGGTMKEGNTDTLDARGRLDVARKTPTDLLEFFLAADYGEQNDQRTKNEYRGGIRYEGSFNERNYWYARLEAEFDEFENLDLRTTSSVGGGRYWIRRPRHELKTSAGIGFRHESFDDGVTDSAAVVDLALTYRLDLGDWARFEHKSAFNPDLEDTDDYRYDADTSLTIPFRNDRMRLKIGIRNEYNSRPLPGIRRLDNTYYANLVFRLR
ncbi:MAG: DUF481 domain-containing protein [Planctomycetota bacterium]|nr:MAG: DUF481 domain-containing protein [Planctomycetota bacterium]